MYGYLSGMASVQAFAVSAEFFIKENECQPDEVNAALKDCRTPSKMCEFKFASDLMAFFAERVVYHRSLRKAEERAKEQYEIAKSNLEKMKQIEAERVANGGEPMVQFSSNHQRMRELEWKIRSWEEDHVGKR